MVSGLGSAYSNYLGQVNGIMEEAGFATNEFATKAQKAIARITAESTKAAKNVKDIASKGEEGFAGLVEAAAAEYKNYEKNTQPYIERNKALAESVTQFIDEYAKLKVPLDTTAATNALGEIEGALYDVVDAAKAAAVALSGVNNKNSGGTIWNTNGASEGTIKKVQEFVGTTMDGIWGANSTAAASSKGYKSWAEALTAYNVSATLASYGKTMKELEKYITGSTGNGYLTEAEAKKYGLTLNTAL
jgi:flagellar hook-basal body complex protein FliE